jgi:hypothetical protein
VADPKLRPWVGTWHGTFGWWARAFHRNGAAQRVAAHTFSRGALAFASFPACSDASYIAGVAICRDGGRIPFADKVTIVD